MGVKVFFRESTLHVPGVTPLPFNVDAELIAPYPLPNLCVSGPLATRTVGLWVIEGDRLTVMVCPELGGRIVGWEEDGKVRLAVPDAVNLIQGGAQGLLWPFGLEFLPAGSDAGSLGPVTVTPHEGGEAPGLVLSGRSDAGTHLWQLALFLSPDSTSLGLELVLYHAGGSYGSVRPGVRTGSAFCVESAGGVSVEDGVWWFPSVPTRPGQVVRFTGVLQPGQGVGREHGQVGQDWRASHEGSAAQRLGGALAAFARDEYPSLPWECANDPALAGCLWGLAAKVAARQGDWQGVLSHVESALETDSRDPRLWWLRAVAARKLGLDDPDAMPNAHYLWPSDPLLKAEAVLGSPHAEGRDAHPIVLGMESDTLGMVEVAAQLCSLHMDEDLHRWVDECLRVRELAILRYLRGYAFLSRSRFHAQAAEEVRLAARRLVEPPFPFRPVEALALGALHRRFPQDARLGTWCALCAWGTAGRDGAVP